MSVRRFIILLLSAASCCADQKPENGKSCDKPNIINGYLYNNYWFPKSLGSFIEYRCNQNYGTPQKDYQGRIQCTKFGWDPEPKCLRQCSYWKANFENAEVSVLEPSYLEGEEVRFRCKSPFLTTDGKTSGTRTCLPDGEFTTAKCSITCKAPRLPNGEYIQIKTEYADNEYLQYKCNEGYMTEKRNLFTSIQCVNGKWSENPKCIAITCTHDSSIYKVKDVITYTCPHGKRPTSNFVQCFHYGWGPPIFCQDIVCTIPADLNVVCSPHRAFYRPNTQVSFSCGEGFRRVGSELSTCTNNGWNPPLPSCQKPCSAPPLLHGKYTPRKREFSNGEYLQYECDKGYMTEKHNLLATAQCLNGELSEIPKCIAITCEHDSSLYKDEDVITYSCPHGKRPKSDLVQCFNYGWGPPVICQEEKPGQPDASNPPPDNIETEEKRQKCPLAHSSKNAEIIDLKEAYYSNDQVSMKCNKGYSMYGSATIRCIAGKWEQPPECYELRDQCGPPPTIEFGDIVEMRKFSYGSGEFVEYQCPMYHVFKGDKIVECRNGVWGEAPVCLKPCTAKEDSMDENNIQLKLVGEKKIYLTHGDEIEFNCIFGYEALPNTQMRITCKHGTLEYPNCLRKGFCILQQSEMIANNIDYNKSTVVERGQTITFQCNEAMIPEKGLEATCRLGNIQYPKCTAANLSV